MDSVIITGLLAYGMSGKVFHAPFLEAHPGFKLHAITERNQKKAQQDYPSLISYNSVDELLDDPAIQLVVINTPNFSHVDYSKRALLKGKHILVEKPFAATVAEALEVFDLAKKVGKQVFVFQNRRWDSDFNSVKKVIEQQSLGKLNEVHFRYDRYRNEIGPKTFKEEPIPASGLLYDLGPHLLDQAISIFGKPLSFHKILGKNRVGTQVDDYFSIHLSYADSVNVFVHANMLVTDAQPAFVLHGTNGSFIKDRTDVQEAQLLKGMKPTDPSYALEDRNKAGKLTLIDEQGNKTQSLVAAEKGKYPELFEAVYASLTADKSFPIREEQILWQLEVLESK
ncbi:putative dehydrogenase [Pedobacter sp. CAN_A7]|uniref:Gfo/Idh/MocA family oxidoreductase n=1 Tax=Pedobacter sp. CAN_A7 TaxID=2787722 RepID=UPI0018C8D9F7